MIAEVFEAQDKNTELTFEEFAKMREPAIEAVLKDYAFHLMQEAEKKGDKLTSAEAYERAKNEVPEAFVPEWVKNIRIAANLAGTEVCYMNEIVSIMRRMEDLLRVGFDKQIDEYCENHKDDFKNN